MACGTYQRCLHVLCVWCACGREHGCHRPPSFGDRMACQRILLYVFTGTYLDTHSACGVLVDVSTVAIGHLLLAIGWHAREYFFMFLQEHTYIHTHKHYAVLQHDY